MTVHGAKPFNAASSKYAYAQVFTESSPRRHRARRGSFSRGFSALRTRRQLRRG